MSEDPLEAPIVAAEREREGLNRLLCRTKDAISVVEKCMEAMSLRPRLLDYEFLIEMFDACLPALATATEEARERADALNDYVLTLMTGRWEAAEFPTSPTAVPTPPAPPASSGSG